MHITALSSDMASINLAQMAYSVNESSLYITVCALLSSCIKVYLPTVILATQDIDAIGMFVVTLLSGIVRTFIVITS